MATKAAQVKQVASVGARDLREQLSDVLNRVAYRGEVFEVVRNGKPVARIVPVESAA